MRERLISLNSMQGLLNVLVIQGHDYSVEVEVFDLDWSLVGMGHVSERTRLGNWTERRRTEELIAQFVKAKTT